MSIWNTHCKREESYLSRKNKVKKRAKNKRIASTKGAGHIGFILLILMLLQEGYFVRVFDNLMYTNNGLLLLFHNKNFEFIKGNIRDEENV